MGIRSQKVSTSPLAMADNPTEHNPHAQSLAFLNEKGAVSNFGGIRETEHVSKNPSDLGDLAEAQVVTTNRPSYLPKPEEAQELQSGPAKKYIDNPQPTDLGTNDNAENDLFASMDSQNNNNVDTFVPSTDNADKQNYESLFAEDQNAQNMNNANNVNISEDKGDDIFGGMDVGGNNNETFETSQDQKIETEQEQNNEEEEEEKQTMLSVWQEQHREHLAEKAKKEREGQEKNVEDGKNALDEFNENRTKRIEQQRKDAQSREADLREDYDAVFKHGTIWQQVAKLVDLKEKNKKVERMRDLIIHLKNAEDRKSDK